MKQYQAYANDNRVSADTPRKAAAEFFAKFPSKRKCNIIEGKRDGLFFVVTYGLSNLGQWPYSVKDVTKKQIETLPD